MSDTPRTDAVCRTVEHTTFIGGKIYQATIETVDASFARQLELELAEARAEIDALRMGKMSPCDYYTSKESEENLCRELAEARAEIERRKADYTEMNEERLQWLGVIMKQKKLIEQMRGALTKLIGTLEVMSVMPETLGKCPVLAIDAPELEQARAALAAERGGKMSRFTPGPWRVDSAGNVVSESPGVVEKIAVSIFVGAERRKANAALIAAAPAMYEALQKCADFAAKTGSEPDVLIVIMQQIAKISEAALRAADGGE